jgi:hypothetical protein
MKEQDLYHWVKSSFGKQMDVVRIENISTSGTPDLNLCFNGIEAWVEVKLLPPKSVLLRPEQYAWSMRRANHGGLCFIVNRDPVNPVLHVWQFPHVEVLPSGKYVRVVNPPLSIIDHCPRQLQKVFFPMF